MSTGAIYAWVAIFLTGFWVVFVILVTKVLGG